MLFASADYTEASGKVNMQYFMWMKSIRSWLALIVVLSGCYLAVTSKLDANKFYDLVLLAMTFYFLKSRPEAK